MEMPVCPQDSSVVRVPAHTHAHTHFSHAPPDPSPDPAQPWPWRSLVPLGQPVPVSVIVPFFSLSLMPAYFAGLQTALGARSCLEQSHPCGSGSC